MAAVCGIIKIELLVHSNTENEYHLIESDLTGIHWFDSDTRVYNKASEIGFALRRKGITIPATETVMDEKEILYQTIMQFLLKVFLPKGNLFY